MSENQNPTFPWQDRPESAAPSGPEAEAAPPASHAAGAPLPPHTYAYEHAQHAAPDAPTQPRPTGAPAPPAAPTDSGPRLPPYAIASDDAYATQPYAGPSTPYAIGAPPAPSNGIAVTALVLAIVGIVLGFIPLVSFLGVALAITAIVLAIVSLAKRRSRRGMSVSALVVAGIGALIGGVVSALTLFVWAAFGGIGSTVSSPAPESETLPEYSSPFADDDQVAAFLDDVAVGETGWWSTSTGYSSIAVFVENASGDLSYDTVRAEVDVLGDDGIALDSSAAYMSIAPGTSVVLVSVPVDADDIDGVDVGFVTDALYTPVPAAGALTAEAAEPVVEHGTVSVPGTLQNAGGDDALDVRVAVIGRDGDGEIVVGRTPTVARVPAGGSAEFEAEYVAMTDDLPADVTYEVYAQPEL